jgi:hypothetical protein
MLRYGRERYLSVLPLVQLEMLDLAHMRAHCPTHISSFSVIIVAVQDLGSSASMTLDPGSGMSKKFKI